MTAEANDPCDVARNRGERELMSRRMVSSSTPHPFRLNQWLGEGTDSLSRSRSRHWAFEHAVECHSTKMSISVTDGLFGPSGSDKAISPATRQSAASGSSEFELRVRTADRELVVDARAGMILSGSLRSVSACAESDV